jgi:hypothetical protein
MRIKFFVLLSILSSFSVMADLDNQVFIRGKIGNVFNEDEVKVTDSYDQVYFLPRKYFPKKFVFKQGVSFAIEIPEEELDKLKVKKNEN